MFLGIDIGTSGVKSVIVDSAGEVVNSSSINLDVQRPNPGWSEQNPADWWDASNQAVLALDKNMRSGVEAIGLTGQMHGAILLDEQDRVLRPAILWNDGRSMKECDELEAACPDLPGITGNRAMPGFTAPKLLWVKKHEPESFKKTAKVLLPKDYVRLCMTGDYASDVSDSAGTLWLNTKARDWSEEVLEATSLTRAQIPMLFEGTEITGQLRQSVAGSWGMEAAPVVAGGGDNAAGAVGFGIRQKGEGFLSLGTSGVIFLADDTYRPNPQGGVHTFCHALPDRWHQMSVMLSAASAVDWAAGICGFGSAADLHAEAEKTGAADIQEIFLPYLSGERTPHNDPAAQGVFFGLTHQTTQARMAQAVLEGVAFGLTDGMEALKATGAEIESLSVIGGGSRSDYWGKILAAVFNVPLTYRDNSVVGPAFGAAQLARIGTGAAVEDVCTPPKVMHVIEPDAALRDQLGRRHELFRSLYPLLAETFKENQK